MSARWSPDRIVKALELRAQGLGPTRSAIELGTTHRAVSGILQRLRKSSPQSRICPPPPVWPPERFALLLKLLGEGLAVAAISDELGITKGAIAGVLWRHGYSAARRQPLEIAEPPPPSLEERLGWQRVIATGCRWIEGDPGEPDWQWCGARCEPGSSWCAEHRARSFTRIPLRETVHG